MLHGTDIFSLKGKTALVTGATGHLGRAMTSVLAEAGATVLVNSRSQERCAALVEEITKRGLEAEVAAFDVTQEGSVIEFAKSVQGRAVHILINNAYVGGAGTVETADASAYASSFDVTMVAAHRLVKALLPNLRKGVGSGGDATIINLASMYALVSPDQRVYDSPAGANPPFYGAAKAALLHWTRYAACEFASEGIRVNAISPGPFPNAQVQEGRPEFVARLVNKVPMNRIGTPEEIRGPILFLASPASSYVTGANIVVDGGWTCW
jgi:NAD(P)-dependent dehydrogenase (short-subunit alcohol dehydrogenase family)